jgi:predicted type IV restriction endonuclease
MTLGDIEQFVQQSTSVLESTSTLDEQTTRTKLIDPFLRHLGWNLVSSDVDLEYPIQMMSSNKQVDYALKNDSEPEVFIEAKRGDSSITEHHIGQLGDYMQKEWVELGLVTNGREFVALKLEPGEGGPPEIIELGKVSLEDLEEESWIIKLFSRESIQAGRSLDIASNIVQRERATEHLRDNRTAIAEEVTEVVTRELDTAIHQESTELAIEFIDDLIDTIEQSSSTPKGGDAPPKPKRDKNLHRPSKKVDQKIAREDIRGEDNDSVVVVPAKIERGLDFLFRNQAWGFVHIGQNPEFVAFYITGGDGISAVWYIARVADVVDIEEAELEDDPEELIDLSDPNERRKKVIQLEHGSLYEPENPIPYSKKYPQSLRYTTLGKIRNAKTTEDLFE